MSEDSEDNNREDELELEFLQAKLDLLEILEGPESQPAINMSLKLPRPYAKDSRQDCFESPWLCGSLPEPDPKSDWLSGMKARYLAGDKFALIEALNHCLASNIKAPTWIRYEFGRAIQAVRFFRVASWDEVLARPVPKGKSVKKYRSRSELAYQLHGAVYDLIEKNPARAIDNDLLSEAAEQFGIGQTLAWEYYSFIRDTDPDFHAYCETNRQEAKARIEDHD